MTSFRRSGRKLITLHDAGSFISKLPKRVDHSGNG
jgi:hypothetical protein